MDNLSWVDNDLAVTKILKYDNSDVENTSGVEIGVEKTDDENNKVSKERVTKFKGQNKYHTTAKSNKKCKHSTTSVVFEKEDNFEHNTTASDWHEYNKPPALTMNKNKTVFAISTAVGVVGLLLMCFAVGKFSGWAETKCEKSDGASDKKYLNEDDFDF